jgi:ATP-dependent DNA ligase
MITLKIAGYPGVLIVDGISLKRSMMKITKTGIPQKYPELRESLARIQYPAFIEAKLDGEFTYLYTEGMFSYMINKYGTKRTDFHHGRGEWVLKMPEDCILVGELSTYEGYKNSIYTVMSNKTNEEVLMFWVHDIIKYKGKNIEKEELITRKEILTNIKEFPGIPLIRSHVVHSKEEVGKYFEEAIKTGYEGIVVKALNSRWVTGPCNWAKLKGKDTTDFKVYAIDPVRERIDISVLLPIDHPNAPAVLTGVKVMNSEKRKLSPGDMVTIEYQGMLKSGRLRHPVYRGKV